MLRCNACWNDLDGKSVVTACQHIFCMNCAQLIVENNTGCTICEAAITKSTVKVVQSVADASAIKLMLCGQTPETVFAAALSSVNFYVGQKQMQADVREAQLNKRLTKMQESCRRKVEEVHKAYTQTKRKFDEAMRANDALQRAHEQSQQDKQELQAKYSQKAMQARKLQEMCKKQQEMVSKQQQEIEMLRQNGGKVHHITGGQGNGRSASPLVPGDVVTTVQRTQVFADLSSPNNIGLGNGIPQALLPSTGRVQGITGGYRTQHGTHSGGSGSGDGGYLGGSGSPMAPANHALMRMNSHGQSLGAGMRQGGGMPTTSQDPNNIALRKMLGMAPAQNALLGGRTVGAMRPADLFTM